MNNDDHATDKPEVVPAETRAPQIIVATPGMAEVVRVWLAACRPKPDARP